jgi:endo-1,4-beta-xylanase
MTFTLPRLSRRGFLLAAAGAGPFGTGCRPSFGEDLGLGAMAASKGLLFGSMISLPTLRANAAYAQLMARECRLYVCAGMHWRLVAQNPKVTNFSEVDAAHQWASAHDMRFRGHALLWHRQIPGWFNSLPDRGAAVAALESHIRAMCKHFAGTMQSWDVVNEAIEPDRGIDGLRKTVLLEKIGPDYLDIAFHAARGADGQALLVLNDFGMEYNVPDHQKRRRALLDLVDGFKRRNTPIDAIGLQSHLATKYIEHLDQRSLGDFLKEISDRGLKILVTELDVVDRASPSDIPSRDAQVAALYRHYLDVVLDNKATTAVVTWGLTDRYSWITRGDEADFHRTDGLPTRPLPFDENCAPKPTFNAILAAFKAAPVR